MTVPHSPGARRVLATALLAVALAAVACGPALAQGLVPLAGKAGCVGPASDEVCTPSPSLENVLDLAASPDGRGIFALHLGQYRPTGFNPQRSEAASGLTWFAREPATGALTQRACLTNNGASRSEVDEGVCADGDAMLSVRDLALTPDGSTAFVVSRFGGIEIAGADPAAGTLASRGCVQDFVRDGRCSDGTALRDARGVAVSPDGRHVYVTAAGSDAIAEFERTPAGTLRQIGCISDDGSDGACVNGYALGGPADIAMSADGRTVEVWATTSSTFLTFTRDPATGLLTQTACLRGGASVPRCAGSERLEYSPDGFSVSPDGANLYLTVDAAVVTFGRRADGSWQERSCLTYATTDEEAEEEEINNQDETTVEEEERARAAQDADCAEVDGFEAPERLTFSADGGRAYGGWESGVWVFRRSEDGALAVESCTAVKLEDGEDLDDLPPACTGVDALEPLAEADGSPAVVPAPDGSTVYLGFGSRVIALAPSAAVAGRAAVRGRSAAVRVACPRGARRGCAGTVELSARGAARRFSLRAGQGAWARLRVPARALRRLRAHRGTPRVTARVRDRAAGTRPAVRRVRLTRSRAR